MAWTDVKSCSGNIDFYSRMDFNANARLNNTGLIIGQGSPKAKLDVAGTTLLHKSVGIGRTAPSSANLHLNGTMAFEPQIIQASNTPLKSTMILAGNSSSNIILNLPDPNAVDGSIYRIKKHIYENELIISSNVYIDNINSSSIWLQQGNPYIELYSSQKQWFLMSPQSIAQFPSWTPYGHEGILGRYDASSRNTFTLSGAEVQSWTDSSSQNHTLSIGNSETAPQLINTTGPRPMIHFTGDSYLECTNFTSSTSGNLSIFIVAKVTHSSSDSSSLISMNNNPPNFDWQWEAKVAGEFHATVSCDGIGSNLPTSSGNKLGSLHLYELVFDTSSQSMSRYVDGLLEASHDNYHTPIAQNQHLRLFSNRNASKDMEGLLAEVIITENLSTLNRQKTEGYLTWKWGISHQLPEDHPYFSHCPRY
ncbi:MAG: hypothetical protein HQL32_00015 [Planctomycetes bacterium]|nr:hypothetical protein [Planctomycetota bacterium]